MMKSISRLNRFLVSQSFYPILLSSMLAMAIFVVRVYFSGSYRIYANLVWNLFLAWIPYLFSLLAVALFRLFPKQWWLLLAPGAIWLAFFPNAPYIVTDFFHLVQRPYIPLWYDILLLTTFSWTGVFLTIASLRSMQSLVRNYLGSFISWLFVAGSMGLCGLGIYLGRFERWNSWDLLTQPKSIIKDVAFQLIDPLSNLGFFGFTMLFTAFLLICYLMFTSIQPLDEINRLS